MTEQTKRADELVFGDKVFDGQAVTSVAYGQTNGDVRLTVLANGRVWQSSPDTLRELATEADIAELEQATRRNEIADSLVELAELIRSEALPLGDFAEFSVGVFPSRKDLESWAAALKVDLTMGGTAGDIPVLRKARVGKLGVSGQAQPDPVEPADEPDEAEDCDDCEGTGYNCLVHRSPNAGSAS